MTYLSYLPHGVINESPTFAPVMQSQSLPRLVFAYKTWSPHPRIRKLQILMQIIQAVQKIPHVPTQD